MSVPVPIPPPQPIRKVLIANRGEIAVRVLRACAELGIRGAVVYSEVDRAALPVLLSDEAWPIGPAPSRESYLRAEAIVELAVAIGADAIHPGYGFLSEQARFARLCRDAGVTFIGPSPEAIAAMGSKTEGRRRMIAAGVPVVPGGVEPLADLDAARAAAAEIGYPVMLKAAAGGGGKGMRRVTRAEDLASAFRGARSEAEASFGDGAVYLEKLIVEPRHVEIQVLADDHGATVSLGERECSLQRRHQKVLEEAPSPAVGPELRAAMGAAAVAAARAVGYTNAGTCEFLLDRDGRFYFLEMNTRLQVEHPVTEMVTGLDLVATQIRIAGGEPLGPEFERVTPRGHAIEVRLYAEDPYRGYAPSPGTIRRLRLPEGPGVRNDFGVYEGAEVPIDYDPLLGKVIVWAADRPRALARLGRALGELRIEGIRTNLPLFRALLEDPDVRAGNLDIELLDRKLAAGALAPPPAGEPAELPLLAAAIVHHERAERAAAGAAAAAAPGARDGSGPGGGLRRAWRLAGRTEALRGSR